MYNGKPVGEKNVKAGEDGAGEQNGELKRKWKRNKRKYKKTSVFQEK